MHKTGIFLSFLAGLLLTGPAQAFFIENKTDHIITIELAGIAKATLEPDAIYWINDDLMPDATKINICVQDLGLPKGKKRKRKEKIDTFSFTAIRENVLYAYMQIKKVNKYRPLPLKPITKPLEDYSPWELLQVNKGVKCGYGFRVDTWINSGDWPEDPAKLVNAEQAGPVHYDITTQPIKKYPHILGQDCNGLDAIDLFNDTRNPIPVATDNNPNNEFAELPAKTFGEIYADTTVPTTKQENQNILGTLIIKLDSTYYLVNYKKRIFKEGTPTPYGDWRSKAIRVSEIINKSVEPSLK